MGLLEAKVGKNHSTTKNNTHFFEDNFQNGIAFWKNVIVSQAENLVRGSVPNFCAVMDYMAGFFILPQSYSRNIGHAFLLS